MTFIDCPHCHASFHTGLLYAPLDSCPRCGRPLYEPRPTFRQQARGILFHRRAAREAPDWEAITGSQYARRRVAS